MLSVFSNLFCFAPTLFNVAGVTQRFNPNLHFSGSDTFVNLVRNGFVLFALVVVALLALRGNSASGRLKKNKARNSRPFRSNTNELGSGDLARKAQIQQWLVSKNKLDTKLPVRDVRCSDGIAVRQGNLVIPVEERNRHILVVAKTGSGKTTRAILPVLFNDALCPERSTIVFDSKPEMWDKLVGLTRKYCPKKKILLFNPLDMERGLSWNILGKIQTDTDCKLIANTVIGATDNPSSRSDSPFFRNNALSLLNSIMVGLLSDPSEVLSMPRVHQLVNCGMGGLCNWLEARPEAIRNCKTFVELARSGSQNADTIMSELGMRLAAWDLNSIRATTALNELDPEALIAEPTLLIVELRESELEMLRPLANVIVVELLRYLTKRAESCAGQRLPRPVSIVIDEFASALGRLPDIHVKLNTLRSRNVSIVAAIQSIAQIRANYDRDADSVLAGFSSKIFMPNLDFLDAEWASKETGIMTVRFNVSSIGKNKRLIDYFATRNENLQEQVQQRAVLTPDEIGRPSDNIATFFLPNTPVFQGHLLPYYEVPELMSKFEATKGMDFKLRETPIDFVEEPLPDVVQAAPQQQAGGQGAVSQSTVAAVDPEKARQQLNQAREALSFEYADTPAQEWWMALEKLNEKSPQSVINLAEQLIKRKMLLADFYQFYVTSGIDNIDALMKAIDDSLLSQFRSALGYNTANQHARDWWKAFEDANRENVTVVMELAYELLKRGVSIDYFFAAYVNSESSSVPELLKALDALIESDRQKSAEKDIKPKTEMPLEVEQSTETAQVRRSSVYVSATNRRATAKSQTNQSKRPTQTVHVDSYLEMANELLTKGKMEEFDRLVQLARDDKMFPPECMEYFEEMRSSAVKYN